MLLWATFHIGLSFHTTLELMSKRIIVGFQLVLDRPAPQLGADKIARPADHMGRNRGCHHDENDDRKVLYIHAMFLDDEEELRRNLKEMECRALELFR